jgi:pilus assembly protein CpaF
VASALDLIVHVERMHDGSRKVTAITEVMRMEGDVVTTQDLFIYEIDEITSHRGVLGALRPTGLRPGFTSKLERHGITMDRAHAAPTPVSPAVAFGARGR